MSFISPTPDCRPNLLRRSAWLALFIGLLAPVSGRAIIFESTGDPVYNTSAPGGALAGSGWELQGRWGNFLGTPIAPNLFITAKHVGGGTGGVFSFRGTNYTVIEGFADPQSDLRIFKVCGIFPAYAPLFTDRNELGKPLVVFGRGTRRGIDVIGDTLTGTEPKGWRWGAGDGVMRWGENVVSTNLAAVAGLGEFLGAAFDAGGGPNEAHLSSGDSGGGLFIKDGAVWKLAGINYAVDGPFNTANTGDGFNAALFDMGGLHQPGEEPGTWDYLADLPVNQPSSFYASRISGNLAWINSIVAQHTVNAYPPVLQFTFVLGSAFNTHPNYQVDEGRRTVTLAEPTDTIFLQLRGCTAYTIESTERMEGTLVLHYRP